MREPRAGPSDEVLEDLGREARQAMRHEPIDPGLFPHLFLPEIADAPEPGAQEYQREAVPQPVADRFQACHERVVQGPNQ